MDRFGATAIAGRIVTVAKDRGWTLREFARRAKLPKGYIGTLMYRIRRNPDTGIETETLRKIATGAKVSLEWLITGEGTRDATAAPEVPAMAPDPITASEALRLVESLDPRLLRALARMQPAARAALLIVLEAP